MSVLIFSEADDRTTSEVMQWLKRWGVACTRIDKEDEVQIVQLSLHERVALIRVNGQLVDLHRYSAIWHRRGYLRAPDMQSALQATWERYELPLEGFLEREWRTLRDYLMQVAHPTKQLGSFDASSVNKLRVLDLAVQCGLQTPKTHVSQCAEQLKKIVSLQAYITKPIGEVFAYRANGAMFQSYTRLCGDEDIDSSLQFPMLVQERVEKWIELRIFILVNKCYAMAIFPKNGVQAAVDYRCCLQNERPRMVPFDLPEEISNKLLMLNSKLGINTSSIDMIVTPDLQYVFLEVNPVGNIEMLSKPCNYPIEREIARYLAK